VTSADTVLWALTKNAHRLEAVQRVVRGLGLALRFAIDGELCRSQIYRNGGDLREAAAAKRPEAEAKGWHLPAVYEERTDATE
jgi:hypothetical protein